MCPRMSKVLAFEIDLRPAKGLGQPLCKIKRRWPADIISGEDGKLPLGLLVLFELAIGFLQFIERRDECLGRKTSAVCPKVASSVR